MSNDTTPLKMHVCHTTNTTRGREGTASYDEDGARCCTTTTITSFFTHGTHCHHAHAALFLVATADQTPR